MLKMAEKGDIQRIKEFCSKYPLGVHTVCKTEAYGLERDFFGVWYCESENLINAVVSRFDGSVTICADESADYEEIFSFVSLNGYDSVCAEKSIIQKCGFNLTSEKTLFRFAGADGFSDDEIKSTHNMKSVYELISEAIPNSFPKGKNAYLSFLSDFTFRQSRDLARVKAVSCGETLLSCALTAAESENAALISGVACSGLQRRKGLGRRTVLTLANELKRENKEVYVIALNDSAKAFYKKIGFEEYCIVGYSER